MAIKEKLELIGTPWYRGTGQDIPSTITLTELPTASELDYVSAEDFHNVMVNDILPQSIEEGVNPKSFLESDYYWVLRALRMMNYGPYIDVRRIFCLDCGEITDGAFQCDIRTVESKPMPKDVTSRLTIKADEFLDFDKDIELKLLTIQDVQNYEKDKQFKDASGETDGMFARLCYSIKSIGGVPSDPVVSRNTIQSEMSPADYRILRDLSRDLTDFGLRSAGRCQCPNCRSNNAQFFCLVDEQFFRPSLDNLRGWGVDRKRGSDDNPDGGKAKGVQRDN